MKAKKKNIYLPCVGSTNRELFRIIEKEDLPEGTVLWTDEQNAGRGMGNASWEAEKGLNVTASFLLIPGFLEPEKQFYLNKAISLGVYDAVNDLLSDSFKTKIKWPNDILVEGKKIAGILIENIIRGSEIQYTVVGIGINVNQTKFKNYPMPPTSFKIITGKSFNISECIESLSEFIHYRYEQLKNEPKKNLDNEYLDKLYNYKVVASYRTKEGSFKAMICGTDKYGKLLLKRASGNTEAYDFKEVEFID